jgi:hypothetical protein
VELPFVAGSWEGFETAFGEGDFQERFHRGTGATTSEVDGPELNKSNTHARAQPKPPPADFNIHRGSFLHDANP